MPLLDSFTVDHTIMPAPAVRLAKKMKTPSGDNITVYDLRFCKPNKDIIGERAIHTFEHLFAGFMREHLNGENVEIIDLSPMGCRTGFYMSVIGEPSEDTVRLAWAASLKDILAVEKEGDIPELNEFQCGTYKMHSLEEAHALAQKTLDAEIGIMNNDDLTLDLKKLGQ